MDSLKESDMHMPFRPFYAATIAALVVGSTFGIAAAAELPAGGHVWVLGVNGTLSARDANTMKTATLAPESGAIALSGNRKRLFGAESAVGRIFEINVKTMVSTPIVELKQPISGICANPDGSRIMLNSIAKKTLHVVDTVTKQAALISVEGKAVSACQFSPDGSVAYVSLADADDILIVDIKTNKVAGKVAVEGGRPSKAATLFIHPNPARKLALVVGASKIGYLDTATQKLSGGETTFVAPIHSVAFHPDGTHYFALAHDKVFLVDLQNRAIQKTIELPSGALYRSMAIDGLGKRLFLSGNHETAGDVGAILNRDGKEFVAIDLDTGKKTYQAFPPVQVVYFIVNP